MEHMGAALRRAGQLFVDTLLSAASMKNGLLYNLSVSIWALLVPLNTILWEFIGDAWFRNLFQDGP